MTIADDPYAASIPWRVTGLLADRPDLTSADDEEDPPDEEERVDEFKRFLNDVDPEDFRG